MIISFDENIVNVYRKQIFMSNSSRCQTGIIMSSPPLALFGLFLLHALGQGSECLLLTIVYMDVLGLTMTQKNQQVLKQPNFKLLSLQGLGAKYPFFLK